MQRPEDFTVRKEALQQLTHSICQGDGCRWGRREVNVWWHLIIYPCDGWCGDEKTAHVGKGDAKPQLLKRRKQQQRDSCSFPRRCTSKKRNSSRILCHFQFGFYFHPLQQQGVPKHTLVLVKATLSLLQALADSQIN